MTRRQPRTSSRKPSSASPGTRDGWRHRPPAQPDVPSAAETAAERAERTAVVQALRALPRRQRDCVTLRYYYDVPIADIAATLGLSVNTVKTHLHRGLEALGTTLEAQR